jgi:hypothetical protein
LKTSELGRVIVRSRWTPLSIGSSLAEKTSVLSWKQRRLSMIRRALVVVALAACAGAYGLAIERATFILIDGERKSGTVVFHTPARENLVNNYLNLGTDDGRELTFPIDQVAVIDFTGGRPTTSELDALPPGEGTHLLVLRDGNSLQGHLLNLVDGETVIWRNIAGQDQRYAIRDVRRIYLNPDRARSTFDYDPNRADRSGRLGRRSQSGVSTSGILDATIRVSARQRWTDSGIDVRQGDRVSFRVTGQIQWGAGPDSAAGADGNPVMMRPDFPVPSAPVGAFIGRIGNGPAFGIGNQTQPLPMPASGRLYLGVNDTKLDDNSGYYTVTITR